MTVELYKEYSDIISSINGLKYLEAESNYNKVVEQDVNDVNKLVALKSVIDRLEAFKPTSSNILLSVGQVRSKIELFIQTNDEPRTRALAVTKDLNELRAFKEVIVELNEYLKEFSSKSDSFISKVGCCLH